MKWALSRCWHYWEGIARAVAEFQSRLLLTLLYFTVLVPFGMVARLLIDPLRIHRRVGDSAWVARDTRGDTHAFKRQF